MLASIEAGNAALKAIEREMSVEDVERIMDDARDGVAYVEVRWNGHHMTRRSAGLEACGPVRA